MYYDLDKDQEHRFSGEVLGNGEKPILSKLAKISRIVGFFGLWR